MPRYAASDVTPVRDPLLVIPVCLCLAYTVLRFVQSPDWRAILPTTIIVGFLLGSVFAGKRWAIWPVALFFLGAAANTAIEHSLCGTPYRTAVPALVVWGLLVVALAIRRLCPVRTERREKEPYL